MSDDFDYILKSVFPIVTGGDYNSVTVIGTCVLITHQNYLYLVTAGHILQDWGKEYAIYVMVGNTAVDIEGPAWISDESFDVAVLPLSNDHNRNLLDVLWSQPAFTLLEYDGRVPSFSECMVVFGFPEKRSKYTRATRELNINPLKYFTDESSPDVYSKYLCRKQTHCLVKYDPKQTKRFDGVAVTAPKPQGASGGPLLRALIDKDNNLICFIFEGIMTRWKDGKNILSTRKVVLRQIIEYVLPVWLVSSDFKRHSLGK